MVNMHANAFHLRLKINITIVPNQHMINKILKSCSCTCIHIFQIMIEYLVMNHNINLLHPHSSYVHVNLASHSYNKLHGQHYLLSHLLNMEDILILSITLFMDKNI